MKRLYALTTLLLVTVVSCRAHQLDLYLDSGDVEQLIGLAARLYYVRNGRPNANAMKYVLEVPASVGALNLTWNSKSPLAYKAAVSTTDSDLVAPKLDMAHEGAVPDTRSVFAVSLPCAVGSGDADVRLSIRTSANWSSDGATGDVDVAFKKFCVDPRTNGTAVAPETGRAAPVYYERAFFYHMIAAASSLVALAVICCLTTTYRRDKARDLMIIKGFQNNEVNVFLKSALNPSGKFNRANSLPGPKAAPVKAKDLHECIVELSVQRQRVRLQNVELEGTFGRVYRGLYTDPNGKDDEVFVKTVTDQASAVQISVLLHEGLCMYGLNHKNVMTIQAVSVEQHVEPFLLYPYSNNTNLKRFLQNCKTSESISYTLTTREIIDMTLQIISGMQYLHKSRHLHRDVAARNCLVDPELKIQIADNALSRDLFPGDYHCLGDNKNRPIKWMAVESLEHKKFSTASDIWSFGVLLWELLTLCQQPYADIDPFEMSAYLQDGFRLTQPVNCPDELFTVMACCWALAPNERPTFSQLSVFMNEFNNQLVKFV
ncbi:WIF domain,Protein kinase domain,Protein kinase-like domain,Tyrosine-protein kinase, catalytic [Cinara cedri]|uniref:receptor protein-tyrosine kinase n=1 Tax=Cinara cedri TaxID=506608 RepID=A0A5E4N4P8_9HEMI|nr:WIF domain,Protein kinase domain,Protein kinase-like domain,Tyrosine-protein kinase, catalytic [Cinara cedri]